MRCLLIVILLAAFSTVAAAQASPGTSGLSVTEQKWSVGPPVGPAELYEDPFQANNESRRSIQDQRDNLRDNRIRAREGKALEPPPVRVREERLSRPAKPLPLYTYFIKVRNEGPKIITLVEWDYLFLDPATNAEVGRHKAQSETKLKPGRQDKFLFRNFSPPSMIVNTGSNKKAPSLYIEQIEIKRVHYSDGTFWQSK